MTPHPIEIHDRLFDAFGPQHWWPGDSPFEVIVGAVLVQNTAWKNVSRAIDNLREAGLRSPEAIHELPAAELEELIQPAGYFRLKTKRLKNVVAFIVDRYGGSLDDMFAVDLAALREELLAINGVGPETADSILLYAGDLPTFVVDTYTARVFKRHEWVDVDADYHDLKEYFESQLEESVPLFNEYHALLVRIGHEFCRRAPKCDECPLRDMLPPGGIASE
jgi:endonuclease-3 related protein